jgi:hypothetical protein
VIDQLNWKYLQPAPVAHAFSGSQAWWISNRIRKWDLARPLREGEFRKALARSWPKHKE